MIQDRTPEPEERRLLHELDNAEKRIRELEVELAQSRSTREGFLIARAEKAEYELTDAKNSLTAAQARVAELEAEIVRWHRRYPKDMSEEAFRLLENENREREEC